MYQVTITNTFPSDSDCDMFIMVLQQQWPLLLKYHDEHVAIAIRRKGVGDGHLIHVMHSQFASQKLYPVPLRF